MMRYNCLNLGIFGGKEENVLHTATIDCQDRAQFGLVTVFLCQGCVHGCKGISGAVTQGLRPVAPNVGYLFQEVDRGIPTVNNCK